jgi:TetR/AcrR family transcriptional repressor of nem operon
MSRKAEQKQRSHDAIIASAAALLRARGIDASSVGEVMRGAGLTVGGFYGHFSSKEELFVETIRSAAGLMWDGLLASAGGQSPRAKVLSVARRYMSRAHRDQPEMGCLLPSIAAEVAPVSLIEGRWPPRSSASQRASGRSSAAAPKPSGRRSA